MGSTRDTITLLDSAIVARMQDHRYVAALLTARGLGPACRVGVEDGMVVVTPRHRRDARAIRRTLARRVSITPREDGTILTPGRVEVLADKRTGRTYPARVLSLAPATAVVVALDTSQVKRVAWERILGARARG